MIEYHWPGAPTVAPSLPLSPPTLSSCIDVKMIRLPDVPTAVSVPPLKTTILPNTPLNSTTTPASRRRSWRPRRGSR